MHSIYLFIKTIISFVRDENYRSLLFTSFLVLMFGTVVYHYLEGWSWVDSVYFCMITLTTVGYGDFSPQTDAGKLFTVFYIILGLGMILNFITTVYTHFDDIRMKSKKKKEDE